jgi:hypothetical protein
MGLVLRNTGSRKRGQQNQRQDPHVEIRAAAASDIGMLI